MTDDSTPDTEQANLDLFREMNNYDERNVEYPSSEVFEHPRRTLQQGWKKFHADRDCGSDMVYYAEQRSHQMHGTEKWEYKIRCGSCGYKIPEEEVLFVGGDWYSEVGWTAFGRPLEDLAIPEHRVLELGPNPSRDDLYHALELGRIEREGNGLTGFSFGGGTWYECDDCGNETPITYDRRCRMCYDGDWTDRMQQTVKNLAIAVRERNHSFVHRLEQEVDPLSIGGKAHTDMVLWRRSEEEPAPKITIITQRLVDDDTGHREYILTDPTRTTQLRYREEDLVDAFYDTGIHVSDSKKPIDDERIRTLWERVRDGRDDGDDIVRESATAEEVLAWENDDDKDEPHPIFDIPHQPNRTAFTENEETDEE